MADDASDDFLFGSETSWLYPRFMRGRRRRRVMLWWWARLPDRYWRKRIRLPDEVRDV